MYSAAAPLVFGGHLANLTSDSLLALVSCIYDIFVIQLFNVIYFLPSSTLSSWRSCIFSEIPFLLNERLFVRIFIWCISTIFPFLFKLFSLYGHSSLILFFSNLYHFVKVVISWIIFFIFLCFRFRSTLNHQLLNFHFWHNSYNILFTFWNSFSRIFFIIVNTSF